MLTKAQINKQVKSIGSSSKAKNAKAVHKVASSLKGKTPAAQVANGLQQQAAVQHEYGYTSAVNAAKLNEQDYNTETARQVQQAKVAQLAAGVQQDATTQTARQASADDYAARGVLRSGPQIQAQTDLTAQDLAARNTAAQTEMGVEDTRQSGLLGLKATGRNNVNSALQTATTNYYNTLKKAK